MENKITLNIQQITKELKQTNKNFKSLITKLTQFKTILNKESSISNKIADKLFDLANLALAGTVFVQLIPNQEIEFSKILPGLVISATIYILAYSIEKRK